MLQLGINDVEVAGPPSCYEMEYQTLLSPEAVKFVAELVRQFDKNVDQVGVIHLYEPVDNECCKLDQTYLIPLRKQKISADTCTTINQIIRTPSNSSKSLREL